MKKFLILLAAVCGLSLAADVPDKPLFKVFDAVCRDNYGKNTLFSPWGIQQCFGMVYGGAGKVSGGEFERVLGIDKAAVKEFRQAAFELKKTQAKFNSFNAVLFNKKYTLKESFIRHAVNQCGGKLYRLDMARKKECVQMLNDMVKRESSGLFDNVFTPQTLMGDPAMILLNVLYFKDAWGYEFQKYATCKEDFTVPSKNWERLHHSRVDMMNCKRYVPYYNDGKVHGIVLDYADRRFKMMVLTTVNPLETPEKITALLAAKGIRHIVSNSSSKNKTAVKLPKLDISGEVDLKTLFSKLGMKSTFDPVLGDLTDAVQEHTLYIAQAKQLVKLKLDENGTEAAAVTYAVAKAAAAIPVKNIKLNRFYADHPFVLVLFDHQTQAVLFIAAVWHPSHK